PSSPSFIPGITTNIPPPPTRGASTTTLPTQFEHEASYPGDCSRRPPGSVCIKFEDGYVWLVSDSVLGTRDGDIFDGKPVEVIIGNKHEYQHVLGTDLVKEVPK